MTRPSCGLAPHGATHASATVDADLGQRSPRSHAVPLADDLILEHVEQGEGLWRLHVRAASATARCPTCQTPCSRVHSAYGRTLADAPCAGATGCFSNYDRPDPADRCDPDAFCCVEGKRGTGKAGEACAGGTDCQSGLCVGGGAAGAACTDKCASGADCPAGMKTCAPLGFDGSDATFCIPGTP